MKNIILTSIAALTLFYPVQPVSAAIIAECPKELYSDPSSKKVIGALTFTFPNYTHESNPGGVISFNKAKMDVRFRLITCFYGLDNTQVLAYIPEEYQMRTCQMVEGRKIDCQKR